MSNFSKGNELYNTRNYSDAINYYKKALNNDGVNATVTIMLAFAT